jgi:4-amino-4-deoxy-L-arabinose transferase-like glycosyltransferase
MVPRAPAIGDNRLLGTAALILGLALVAAAAWLSAASLSLRSAIDFLLAVYLCTAGGIMLLALVLSPFDALTRGWLLVGSGLLAAIACFVWILRGRPAAPPFGPALRASREVLRDPVVAVPAAAVGVGLAYSAVLAIATPPNDYDTLWYHLSRAAFWRQEHAVGYVERANDLRLDVFTPGAELVSSWAMTLSGNERFAGLLQLFALVATMLAVAGIARKLGFDRRAAALGAVLFASLPVVALQASTALNDLAVASFLVIVVYYLLQGTRAHLALGALALALAVATKATALLALAPLALLAFGLAPRRRWLGVAVAGVAGIALGAFWYFVNREETGSFIPRFAPNDLGGTSHDSGVVRYPAQFSRLVIDAVDPAGSVGRDRYLYVVAAVIVLVVGVAVAARRRSRVVAVGAVVTAAVVLVPVAFVTVHERLLDAFQRAWLDAGEPDLAFLGADREAIPPSPFVSWYGPLGVLMVLATVPLAIREIRRGALRKAVVVLALAPVLYLAVVTVGLGYTIFHGRYLMPAVAVAATTWGLVLRVRALAWAAATIATVTVCLSFVHYVEKPAGFAVLGGTNPRSVWNESRVEILAHSRAPGGAGPLRVIEQRAVPGDTVALRIRQDDVSYPFFGADLDRRIVFVEDTGGLDAEADWLVVAPGLHADVCDAGWRSVPTGEPGWRLYRRVGLCPWESAAS